MSKMSKMSKMPKIFCAYAKVHPEIQAKEAIENNERKMKKVNIVESEFCSMDE
jgi:hypothetical protein